MTGSATKQSRARFSETPISVRSAGPSLGQHNEETYGALGLSREEIGRLRAAGII
jgi:crotonobetainyl-CoA:carnitine CoA-transferase CaiB-like acyl-CoA transferase